MKKESIGSVSLITQGNHKFYTFTIESDLLADTCFVTTREEDPEEGFQRELDINRAKEIAVYIDSGMGTIPSSIILSAQEEAELTYNSKSKTVSFNSTPRSFLIIDGQHRVYGFKLSQSKLRVPVVVYDGLSRPEEARLFIDINSKQKGVRPELLLDIKKLAETESSKEELFREIYDTFLSEKGSALFNKLSPSKKSRGKISRATFNAAMNFIYNIIEEKSGDESYTIINNYLHAFTNRILRQDKIEDYLIDPIVFRAIIAFLPTIAMRVKDKFGAIYTIDHFDYILKDININKTKIVNHGKSYQHLLTYFIDSSKTGFML